VAKVSEIIQTERLNRINARATDEQLTAVRRAVDLWLARHGGDRPATPETTAEALAAICGTWRGQEIDRLSGGL